MKTSLPLPPILLALSILCLPLAGARGADADFVGFYTGKTVALNVELAVGSLRGQLVQDGKAYPFRVLVKDGVLWGRSEPFDFTLAPKAGGYEFSAGDNSYRLKKEEGEAAGWLAQGLKSYYGVGAEKDYTEAVRNFKKGAERGIAYAQNRLGACYANGFGMEKDSAEAVRWYRKAAEQGLAAAQYNLGAMFDNGEGVEKDYAESLSWYRKAADQGDATAQFILALKHSIGKEAPKDNAESLRWLRKAADQGLADAQYWLGRGYHDDDIGVAKSRSEAVKWFRKAAAQGHAESIKWLKDNGESLTP